MLAYIKCIYIYITSRRNSKSRAYTNIRLIKNLRIEKRKYDLTDDHIREIYFLPGLARLFTYTFKTVVFHAFYQRIEPIFKYGCLSILQRILLFNVVFDFYSLEFAKLEKFK